MSVSKCLKVFKVFYFFYPLQQPQAARESETQLTNYLTKSSTRVKFGRRGGDVGCFTWPRGIAVNEDGEIVVADSSNHRSDEFEVGYYPITGFV